MEGKRAAAGSASSVRYSLTARGQKAWARAAARSPRRLAGLLRTSSTKLRRCAVVSSPGRSGPMLSGSARIAWASCSGRPSRMNFRSVQVSIRGIPSAVQVAQAGEGLPHRMRPSPVAIVPLEHTTRTRSWRTALMSIAIMRGSLSRARSLWTPPPRAALWREEVRRARETVNRSLASGPL